MKKTALVLFLLFGLNIQGNEYEIKLLYKQISKKISPTQEQLENPDIICKFFNITAKNNIRFAFYILRYFRKYYLKNQQESQLTHLTTAECFLNLLLLKHELRNMRSAGIEKGKLYERLYKKSEKFETKLKKLITLYNLDINTINAQTCYGFNTSFLGLFLYLYPSPYIARLLLTYNINLTTLIDVFPDGNIPEKALEYFIKNNMCIDDRNQERKTLLELINKFPIKPKNFEAITILLNSKAVKKISNVEIRKISARSLSFPRDKFDLRKELLKYLTAQTLL